GGERRAIATTPPERERKCADGRDEEQPLPHGLRIDLPARIKEREIGGPDEFCEVEPNDASREECAFDGVEGEFVAGGADVRFFHPNGAETRDDPEHEPREEKADLVAPREAAALPPRDHEKRRWQCGGDGFA